MLKKKKKNEKARSSSLYQQKNEIKPSKSDEIVRVICIWRERKRQERRGGRGRRREKREGEKLDKKKIKKKSIVNFLLLFLLLLLLLLLLFLFLLEYNCFLNDARYNFATHCGESYQSINKKEIIIIMRITKKTLKVQFDKLVKPRLDVA